MSYNSRKYRGDIRLHLPKLEELASNKQLVIELGVEHGNGATQAFMNAAGLQELVCMDIVDVRLPYVKEQFDGDERFNFYLGSSTDESLRDVIINIHGMPNVILVDSEHTAEQVEKELKVWSPLVVGKDTLYLFHDTYMHGRLHAINISINNFVEEYGMTRLDLSKESHGLTAVYSEDCKKDFFPNMEEAE